MKDLCGVLAMQGAYAKHCESLRRLGAQSIEVRSIEDLERCARLVLPGGESSTMYRLLQQTGLWQPLQQCIRAGMPVFGTCAGMILLSRQVSSIRGSQSLEPQPCLAAMDLEVQRNAYGRQIASFSAKLDLSRQSPENPGFAEFLRSYKQGSLELNFIRAPLALRWGPEVQVLLRYSQASQASDAAKQEAICLQQGRVLVSSFHPELSENTLLHSYFLSL